MAESPASTPHREPLFPLIAAGFVWALIVALVVLWIYFVWLINA